MIVLRFFALLFLTTLVSFFRLTPWAFVRELLIMPGQFLTCMSFHDDDRITAVQAGTRAMLKGWREGSVIDAPGFIIRRFEALEKELS